MINLYSVPDPVKTTIKLSRKDLGNSSYPMSKIIAYLFSVALLPCHKQSKFPF